MKHTDQSADAEAWNGQDMGDCHAESRSASTVAHSPCQRLVGDRFVSWVWLDNEMIKHGLVELTTAEKLERIHRFIEERGLVDEFHDWLRSDAIDHDEIEAPEPDYHSHPKFDRS